MRWFGHVMARCLDLVYVPRCVSCDDLLDAPDAFCSVCAASLYPLGPSCARCALPLAFDYSGACGACRRDPPPQERTVAAFRYGGELAEALRRLKFGDREDIARSLGPVLGEPFRVVAAEADVAIAVPLHWRRMLSRGFNQAALLLAEARRASRSHIPVDPSALRRRVYTSPQTGLSRRMRQRNVAGAFDIPPRRRHRIAGKRILLVDDVVTTGATIAAASRALLRAGAISVVAFAAARAEP
jgi:ComF family protein